MLNKNAKQGNWLKSNAAPATVIESIIVKSTVLYDFYNLKKYGKELLPGVLFFKDSFKKSTPLHKPGDRPEELLNHAAGFGWIEY